MLWDAGDSESGRRQSAGRDEASLSGATPGAGHEGSGELLERGISSRAQGYARALSEALLAGGSVHRRRHPPRPSTVDVI